MKSKNKLLYSVWSKYYNQIANQRDHYQDQFELIQSLLHYLNVDKNKKILDAACGTGEVALKLYESGFQNIYLNDISEEMLSQLNPKESNKLKISKYAWEDLNVFFSNNSQFDLVYILGHSLSHAPIENIEIIFKNIFDGLKKNSFFVFDMRKWINSKEHELIQGGREPNKYRDLGIITLDEQKFNIYDKVYYEGRTQFVDYKIQEYSTSNICDKFTVQYTIFTENEIKTLLTSVGFSNASNISEKINNWSYETICCLKE